MTMKAYEEHTKEFRELQSPKPKTRLFLSWIGEHNPVTSSSIARWLKQTMKDPGIDVSILKSHSVRRDACSKAAGAGVNTGSCRLVFRRHFPEVLSWEFGRE